MTIDAELMRRLWQIESGGNPNAVSPKGAFGPWQIMPATARDPGYGVRPLQNMSLTEQERFATDYAKAMERKFGSDKLALAAYNAGPGAVEKYGGVPPYKETQDYVRKFNLPEDTKVAGLVAHSSRTRPSSADFYTTPPIAPVPPAATGATLPPSLPPGAVIGPPKTPEEVEQRKGGWKEFLHKLQTDPEYQAVLLHFGTQMLQGGNPGDSTNRIIGGALQSSAQFLANSRAYRAEEARRQKESESVISGRTQQTAASKSAQEIAEAAAPIERTAKQAEIDYKSRQAEQGEADIGIRQMSAATQAEIARETAKTNAEQREAAALERAVAQKALEKATREETAAALEQEAEVSTAMARLTKEDPGFAKLPPDTQRGMAMLAESRDKQALAVYNALKTLVANGEELTAEHKGLLDAAVARLTSSLGGIAKPAPAKPEGSDIIQVTPDIINKYRMPKSSS